LALVVVYVVALLAIPSDIGLHLGALVLSPSRIVLCALVALVLIDSSLRDALRSLPKLVLAGWLAFLISAAVTTLLNYSNQSLSRYGSLAVEGLALWAIVWCIARGRRGSDVLQVTIVAATTFVAGVTLLLAAFNLGYGDVLRNMSLSVPSSGEVRFGLLRQAGSFPEPLFFATWLVGASMLILRWLEDERRLVRFLAWAAWAILFLATIETVSRVGIVLVPAATGAYFLLRRRPGMGAAMFTLAFMTALIVGGVATLPSLPSSLTPSPAPTAAPSATPAPGTSAPTEEELRLNGSTTMRIESLQAAWSVLLEKPLFGWGLLNAGPVLSAQVGHPEFVDDTYITCLVELGLFGIAALGLLVLAAARAALRGPWSPVRLSRLFAPAVLLGMMVFASFLSITQGYAGFVLLVALATLEVEARPAEARFTSA
jgi:hypothetical protein